jgi:hypothetical protein
MISQPRPKFRKRGALVTIRPTVPRLSFASLPADISYISNWCRQKHYRAALVPICQNLIDGYISEVTQDSARGIGIVPQDAVQMIPAIISDMPRRRRTRGYPRGGQGRSDPAVHIKNRLRVQHRSRRTRPEIIGWGENKGRDRAHTGVTR